MMRSMRHSTHASSTMLMAAKIASSIGWLDSANQMRSNRADDPRSKYPHPQAVDAGFADHRHRAKHRCPLTAVVEGVGQQFITARAVGQQATTLR